MEVRLASDRPPDSPDSDIDVWLEKQVRLPVAVAPLRASRARDFPIRGLRCRPLSSGWKNMRAVILVVLWCFAAAAFAQADPVAGASPIQSAGAPAPVSPVRIVIREVDPAVPKPEGGFVIEHVPEQLAPDVQRVENRCVRSTSSHAAVDRDSRPTKGTRGTHGPCVGQGFRGAVSGDNMSGVQDPAAVR